MTEFLSNQYDAKRLEQVLDHQICKLATVRYSYVDKSENLDMKFLDTDGFPIGSLLVVVLRALTNFLVTSNPFIDTEADLKESFREVLFILGFDRDSEGLIDHIFDFRSRGQPSGKLAKRSEGKLLFGHYQTVWTEGLKHLTGALENPSYSNFSLSCLIPLKPIIESTRSKPPFIRNAYVRVLSICMLPGVLLLDLLQFPCCCYDDDTPDHNTSFFSEYYNLIRNT
jgi:hypothetical protein